MKTTKNELQEAHIELFYAKQTAELKQKLKNCTLEEAMELLHVYS